VKGVGREPRSLRLLRVQDLWEKEKVSEKGDRLTRRRRRELDNELGMGATEHVVFRGREALKVGGTSFVILKSPAQSDTQRTSTGGKGRREKRGQEEKIMVFVSTQPRDHIICGESVMIIKRNSQKKSTGHERRRLYPTRKRGCSPPKSCWLGRWENANGKDWGRGGGVLYRFC